MADTVGKLFDLGPTRWHNKLSEISHAITWRAARVQSQTRKENVAGQERRKSQEDFDEAEIIDAVCLDAAKAFDSEHSLVFRGKCPFHVFIKSKQGKYGVRVWVPAHAKNFYAYTM